MIDWESVARQLNDEVIMPMAIGGNHLASHAVLRNWPEWTSDPLAVLERMGAGLEYDAWCCWAAIMKAMAAKRQIRVAGD